MTSRLQKFAILSITQPWDCSLSLKFRTDFDHVTPDVQKIHVQGQRISERDITYQHQKNHNLLRTDAWLTQFKLSENYLRTLRNT